MANLHWTDYVLVSGAGPSPLSFLPVTAKVRDGRGGRRGVASGCLPTLSHLWYLARHREKAPGRIAVGAAGVPLVMAGSWWRPPRP